MRPAPLRVAHAPPTRCAPVRPLPCWAASPTRPTCPAPPKPISRLRCRPSGRWAARPDLWPASSASVSLLPPGTILVLLSSPPRLVRVRDRELVTLGGRPPSWLGGWCSGDLFKKIVKRPGLLLRGACEVVVELAISGAEEKLTIRKWPLSFVGVVRRIGGNKELEAQVLSLKKDLEKRHEGKSALDKMLSVQQSPNDKSGLGFKSNNKNKSKSKSNKKKGQDKVKDPAKLVCFKCKVEGHHVRSCPLKKKKHLSEKQQGKRPQGQGQAHARPQVEDRPLPKKNQDIVPQEKKSIKKRKGNTCYLCREKGHFASSCLSGTLSNPIIVDDDYSLSKDKDGNVFAKFVGTQSGFKKRTIWVAKPIVTNLLGPNLVGDQQAQT
ncbi:hypothetical protein QYE76_064473 [Lolium multiflorum]|uniref:CCHC-type domain-containing protein n=1 Tax=Lolium multiflorum TaxID=4521 RepID=A0AAD8W7Z4_LOLMU|nr:hypothetical protein QYE76_064473 [Lolium multiflorum]